MALSVQPLANPYQIQGGTDFYNIAPSAPAPTYTEATPTYAAGGGSYGGGSYGGGTSYAAAAPPPPDLSSYDQSINNTQSGIDRLGSTAAVGHENILKSYNSAYGTLLGQKDAATNQYKGNKVAEGQSFVGNKNNINSGVGQQVNATQRLLGSRGAGGSSAALINAPQNAARNGNLQRNAAGQTFSKNNQALDQNFGEFNQNWTNSSNKLSEDRTNQDRSLDAGIENNRASLLQTLAGLRTQRAAASGMTTAQAVAAGQPYINQANGALDSATQLGANYANPSLQAAQVAYKAPDLSTYLAAQHGPVSLGGGNALTDSISPYINLLLGKDRTKLGA